MDKEKPIFKSLTMIEERIQDKITVESLAQSLHFSRYHYQRLFREVVGESVMRYVAKRRLSLAAKELATSGASILDIALRYGYDSHEGFTRSFKAYMGVTPIEYRKYHSSISSPKIEKEKCAMLYSKTTDEIIRELNNLIVQTKETAAFAEKTKEKEQEIAIFYGSFLELLSQKTLKLSDDLSRTLETVTDIAHCPDQISARFLMVKTIEDAAFWTNILAFQASLTIARATTEHQVVLTPIRHKYELLAKNARIKTEKITGFFQELTTLIFQDMRGNAAKLLQDAIIEGKAAGQNLLDAPALPYAYIGNEILVIAGELSSMPLEMITTNLLEDCLFRTDLIAFSADMDVLRQPSHQSLFEGISRFRLSLEKALDFFQRLTEDIFTKNDGPEKDLAMERNMDKCFSDLAFQGNILLFYLRGELRKLGSLLDEKQTATFDSVCNSFQQVITIAHHAKEEADLKQIGESLNAIYQKTTNMANELSNYGAPLLLIAGEIGQMAKAVQV